jgi:hypothetical protein
MAALLWFDRSQSCAGASAHDIRRSARIAGSVQLTIVAPYLVVLTLAGVRIAHLAWCIKEKQIFTPVKVLTDGLFWPVMHVVEQLLLQERQLTDLGCSVAPPSALGSGAR